MMRRLWPVWAMAGWSIVLWASRTNNVLSNDELSGSGRLARLAVVVVFVGLAVWSVVAIRREWWVPVWILIVWTAGFWVVRGGGILIDDYSAGFKAIHTVLAVVSIGLAALSAMRLVGDRSFGDNG